MSPETGTALERWTFDIHLEPTAVAAAESGTGKPPQNFKSEQQIHLEIAAILRQITASVSFLPILGDEPLSFNILAYTDTRYGRSRLLPAGGIVLTEAPISIAHPCLHNGQLLPLHLIAMLFLMPNKSNYEVSLHLSTRSTPWSPTESEMS